MKLKYPTTLVLSQTKQIYFLTSMNYRKLRHCCLKKTPKQLTGSIHVVPEGNTRAVAWREVLAVEPGPLAPVSSSWLNVHVESCKSKRQIRRTRYNLILISQTIQWKPWYYFSLMPDFFENCERQLMVELVYTWFINTYLCLILLCGPLWVLCWPSMLRLHSSANQSHLLLACYCSHKCPPQNHSSLVGGTDLAGSWCHPELCLPCIHFLWLPQTQSIHRWKLYHFSDHSF